MAFDIVLITPVYATLCSSSPRFFGIIHCPCFWSGLWCLEIECSGGLSLQSSLLSSCSYAYIYAVFASSVAAGLGVTGRSDLAAESALTTWPWIFWTRYLGSRMPTMLNSLHAVSLGCAPTPIQYLARLISSLISFQGRPCVSPGRGGFGIGSYVPRTSRGSELRAVRACATTML